MARFLSGLPAIVAGWAMACASSGPAVAQDHERKQFPLSAGQAVPAGQFDAIGTVPGCTATLVYSRLVLTAAHCVCPSQHNAIGCATRVSFTLHDVLPASGQPPRRDIVIGGSVRVHPEYTQRGWLREDYAVVELDQSAPTLAQVTPLAIAQPYQVPVVGQAMTLVGYGATGPDCRGPGLGKRKMDVPVHASGWGGIEFRNAQLHSCPGDSGGPVLDASQQVVGVASWGDGSSSTYRPTSFAHDWIVGLPTPKWGSCSWVPVPSAGRSSHQPRSLCPDGTFLTALDLDGDRSVSAHDAPLIGQARCCKVSGAEHAGVDLSLWVGVERAGLNSHLATAPWCPKGSFITGIDLDACAGCDAADSPVVGQVQCTRLQGFANWGSTYWMDVGAQTSHQAGASWCLDGAFVTQIDLDRVDADAHDSPIVARAKCSTMAAAAEQDTDRPGADYKRFDLPAANPAVCQAACRDDAACKAWTYVRPGVQGPGASCWLKSIAPSPRTSDCCISGLK